MEQEINQLPDVLILLAAAVIIVAVFRLLKLSPVLGFLFAGAAIGPFGFGLVSDIETKSYLAEFGVVFLLFMIGLELSFKKLSEMRLYVIGIGSTQIILTGLIICLGVLLITDDIKKSIVIGAALALSSTAIVLQVLDERGERLGQTGRVSFAVLLMQDLAVIPLLILVPVLAGEGGNITYELGNAFLRAMAVVIALVFAGRIILRPFLRLIAKAKSDELFVATALLLALGASFATEHFGLSMALGAFISGLLLSETEFQKQVEADILPFKGLLMGLFFMTVGMRFNINHMLEEFPLVLAFSTLLIFVKASIIILVCKLFKLRWRTAVKSGLLLAQGSEFAFILFNLAVGKNLIDAELGQMLLLIVTSTMALTPLVFSVTNHALNRIARMRKRNQITETEDLEGHIILIGFGWVGENLGKILSIDNYSYVAVDQEVKRVKSGRDMGIPVYYGDASRPEILESLQIKKARAVVITIHDPKPILRIIQTITHLYPGMTIIVRARHIENIEAMRKQGASIVIPEAYESAIQIAKSTLQVIGSPQADIDRLIKKFSIKEINKQDIPVDMSS